MTLQFKHMRAFMLLQAYIELDRLLLTPILSALKWSTINEVVDLSVGSSDVADH